jgi:exopolyphosphatase/guanosine-5'-triphosphate,3'-diphosphate pyrophosphatase
MLHAVIDLGTNTFNLLIANRLSREVIYKEKQAVQLGKGGISKGIIAEEAIERAINSLLSYKAKIEAYKVADITVTGTSAIRNAKNQTDFVQTILDKTGFKIKVLSGDEEASRIYDGVSHFLNFGKEAELIIDIGGGSVEFIIANDQEVLWMRSLEIGGQRLMDQFHNNDPIDQGDIEKLNSFLKSQLEEVIQKSYKHNVKKLIGSAGSFDTLQDMLLKSGYDKQPDNSILPIDYFHSICADLTSKKREERLKIPGMIAMRVDMIVVASLLIKLLVEELELNQIRVSSFALKEGVLFGSKNKMNA